MRQTWLQLCSGRGECGSDPAWHAWESLLNFRAYLQNKVILLLSSHLLSELPKLPSLLSSPSVPVLITAQQTHPRVALIYEPPCRELPLWKPEYSHFLTQVLKNCHLPVTFTGSFLHGIHFTTIAFCTTRILKDWNNFSPYSLNITR